MSNATCETCGTALIAGAKFCRQCGKLVVNPSAPAVTEATTRTLRTPVEFGVPPTNYIPTQPTGPAYMAPGEMPSPPAYATSNLEQRKPQRNVWLIVLLTMVLLAAIGGALIALGVIKINGGRTSVTPPIVAPPAPPPPPGVPEPKTPTSNSIRRDFIYPGAETVMEMKRADGGNFLQLQTKDSYQKVLDWYVAKLKPEQIIKSPGPNAVLKSDQVMAILTPTGEGTNIMLKEMSEMEKDEP